MKNFNSLNLILGSLFSLLINLPADAIVFNMAPLEFTNRAGCADLSTKPARSVFLQIDAFSAGKAGYAQGIVAQNTNPKEVPGDRAAQSARDFRIWSSHLAFNIMNALIKGQLPLLQPDGSAPAIYKNAVDKCLSKNQFLTCPAMNDLLSELWSRSKMKNPNWQDLGLTSNDFLPNDLRANAAIGCHIIRKFSAFHSDLATQHLDNGTLTNIAMDAFKPDGKIDSCFSVTDGADPRYTTLQLDVANLSSDTKWSNYGFQFWHSFKLFYSWGWRYAPEYVQEFGGLKQSFSSIAFEDSVMLIPNGCRSVELPKCDSAGLSADVLRAAQYLGGTDPAINEFPPKPIDTLFQGQATPVNNDSLGLYKAENASAWSKDFRAKLTGIRAFMSLKLNTGMAKLQVITSLLDVNELTADINLILKDPTYDPIETYLACMEFTLAKNDLFDDISAEIATLSNTQELSSVLLAQSGQNLNQFVTYYKTLTDTMVPFCKALEAQGRGAPGIKDPKLFLSLNQWAFDLLRPKDQNSYTAQCVATATTPANAADCPKNQDKQYLVSSSKNSDGSPGDPFIICKTSLECSRIVLDSLVSVIAVRRYAHAFFPIDDLIKSPDILNNYAAPVACHLYDPWAKQRNSWKLFVADMGSALLSGASCGIMNFKVLELPTNQVVGFKEIYDQEQANYTPITEKQPLKYVASVDYGFLPGLACGASVSNTILTSGTQAIPGYFGQFGVRTCTGSSKTDYTVDKNVKLDPSLHAIVKTDQNTKEFCFACSFGLTQVATGACFVAPFTGQIIATSIGLFQGVMRLVSNLSDPDNIVRNTQVNVDQISESYQDTTTQTPLCHFALKHGLTCSPSKKR